MLTKYLESLFDSDSHCFAFTPCFLVTIGKRTTNVSKAEQRTKQFGEIVLVANRRFEQGFDPVFEFAIAVGGHRSDERLGADDGWLRGQLGHLRMALHKHV